MSQGTVCNILEKIKTGAKPAYDTIRERVAQLPVVGADETGQNINGKLCWLWVWQTEKLTYLASHKKRGQAAIENEMLELIRESIHQRKTLDWIKIDRKSIIDRLDKLLEESLDRLMNNLGECNVA